MLKLENIQAGYGPKQVLNGVALNVNAGEIVALLGPNGAGKSTVLKVIAGLLKPSSGEVLFLDRNITSIPTHCRVRAGIGYVMQNAPVFGSLTVAEHYHLLPLSKEPGMQRSAVPGPNTKRGGVLSGGERQRLAVELCLARRPKLLLLDEPSAGVSPGIAQQIYDNIREQIAGTETAVLMVEQNLQFLPDFATRVIVMRNGEISNANLPLDDLEDSEAMFNAFYGDFVTEHSEA